MNPIFVEINPVSPFIDMAMTVGVFCLWIAAPVIVAIFWALS